MPDITDPTANAFINSAIRPIADRLVGLKVTLDVELAKYNAIIAPILVGAASGDQFADGSQTNGRTTIDKNDLELFITQLNTIQAQLEGAGVFDVVSKPHVNVIMP